MEKSTDDAKSVISICLKNHQRYGYRKVTATLKKLGMVINHKKVLRIMKENQLLAKVRRKKNTFFTGTECKAAPNIIQRMFKANQPNQKWYTDISYLLIGESPLYLSVIMDGFNGEIISSKISQKQDLELAKSTLLQALSNTKASKLILHSDQGSVYKSVEFQKCVTENSITMSMSRRGNCHDNAAMESFFSSLKTEVFYSQNIKKISNTELTKLVLEYIQYYNYERIQAKLNYLSPIEYRKKVA